MRFVLRLIKTLSKYFYFQKLQKRGLCIFRQCPYLHNPDESLKKRFIVEIKFSEEECHYCIYICKKSFSNTDKY